jgi:hypothetical protein
MSFLTAEAFTRIMPELVRLTLPQGVIDMERPIPAQDVTLLATRAKIIVRKDIHPEILYLLLKTLISEHGVPDIFQKSGEFPMAIDTEYPLSDVATEYYKNGPTFLQRHLPFWWSIHAQRFIALVIALAVIGVPLVNYIPRTIQMVLKYRIRTLYGRVSTIERALQTDLLIEDVLGLLKKIEEIDKAASALATPRFFMDIKFGLKVHINLVRTRLLGRRDELMRPATKVA